MYRLGCTSDKIWDITKLISYLSSNQNVDIKIAIEPEAICLRSLGLYDLLDCFQFRSVEIFTANPFEHHDRYKISHSGFDTWFDHKPKIQTEQQSWNGKKIFLCLFGRPTAGRLALAGHCFANYRSQSHIHFSTGTDPDDCHNYEMDKLLSYDPEMIENVGSLIKVLPLLLNSSHKRSAFHGYDYTDPLTDLYRDIFVDIVVESHVLGNTFFPTEKIARTIWLKKPFVVFASRNFLDYLHQMGFRSFCDFWSEDYDGFEGKERLSRLLSLLDHIASLTTTQRKTMLIDMHDTLDHNYRLLSERAYHKQVTYIP
jgi:hypothetical protein